MGGGVCIIFVVLDVWYMSSNCISMCGSLDMAAVCVLAGVAWTAEGS